ncbi:GcrA family cell cycle regulator [Mesorhizobium sp.]|uniref:GcrA family cell cycle regulator n=1 Tax=Mesorhizobium sp. TaxID=1871066 RepID=UPI0012247A9F|nr:GcrA family cell cycle regulator [Mesorhizobium sp.]TIS37540.1 MAG: hypothetical protein E5W95_18180 [Mesorhizobium sp.]
MKRSPTTRQQRPSYPRWTPELDEQLKGLLEEKLTASQIAARFGNFSRNAIIGRTHRLKLNFARPRGHQKPGVAPEAKPTMPAKPRLPKRRRLIAGVEQIVLSRKPGKSKPVQSKRAQPEPALPAVIPTFVTRESYFLPLADTSPIALSALSESKCRWPVDGIHGREGLFCGEHAHQGVYCRVHRSIAYQPNSSMMEKRRGANTRAR